jgi:hypothetical protein
LKAVRITFRANVKISTQEATGNWLAAPKAENEELENESAGIC